MKKIEIINVTAEIYKDYYLVNKIPVSYLTKDQIFSIPWQILHDCYVCEVNDYEYELLFNPTFESVCNSIICLTDDEFNYLKLKLK